jgi:hypothetical protein
LLSLVVVAPGVANVGAGTLTFPAAGNGIYCITPPLPRAFASKFKGFLHHFFIFFIFFIY